MRESHHLLPTSSNNLERGVFQALALILLPVITLVAVSLFAHPSFAQESCRTRCDIDEMKDADGCCVRAPSARTRSNTPPKVTPEPGESSTSAVMFQSYHLSGELSDERSRDALIGALGALKGKDSIEALEERASLAWAILLSMEQEMLQLSQACMQSSHSKAEFQECAKHLEGARAQRATFLTLAMPTWRALIERAPETMWRAQTRYYLAIATMLSLTPTSTPEQEAAGLAMLGELLSKKKESDGDDPYRVLAMLAIADHLQAKGKYTQARALYLKAQLQKNSRAVQAYGAYMEGWCLASEGDLEGAMRAMLLGYKRAGATSPAASSIESRKALTTALGMDITLIYAYAGQPANALQFYEALGIPAALLPIELMRLARRYEMLGKIDEARLLYRALSSSSSEARERLEALPAKK